ncbi:MAG: ABC transporter permease [Actinomycetota bacterium]|nr:ABC transporter permease [Actinomycetota bacterium]
MSTKKRATTDVVLIALAISGIAFFAIPLAGLLVRSPWSEFGNQLRRTTTLDAAKLSIVVSLSAVALSTVLGFPIAWLLARSRARGTRLLRGIVLIPMILPPVVGGIALFTAFGRNGLLGNALQIVGVSLPFTTGAAVVAATFVSAPFLIITVEAGLHAVDQGLEDAAATLGAGRLAVLRTVTIPAIRPALMGGLALCWARALGEFGATITFAGNFQGRTQTLPLDIYQTLQTDPQGAVMLSVILLAAAVAIFVALRGRLRFG